MTKRLLQLCQLIPLGGKGFADVGTDHGFVPVWLANHGYSGKIYAFDISEAPLKKAVSLAKEQKVDFLIQECRDKIKSLINIANKMSIGMSEILYIGDDIIDLCALKKAGLSVCPKDAVVEAKKVSKYISQYDGGKGVFREVCELLLKANKKWDEILSK